MTGPPEQGGGGGQRDRKLSPLPSQSFLSMCPFFRRTPEVPILKEVTKNVHES